MLDLTDICFISITLVSAFCFNATNFTIKLILQYNEYCNIQLLIKSFTRYMSIYIFNVGIINVVTNLKKKLIVGLTNV